MRADGDAVPLDVHLMVQPVDALVEAFAEAGADVITFHPEASAHVDRTLQLIRPPAAAPGSPSTRPRRWTCSSTCSSEVDLVLIMSVNPGFGGQSFIDSALRRSRARRR